jgi:hypothetical protein
MGSLRLHLGKLSDYGLVDGWRITPLSICYAIIGTLRAIGAWIHLPWGFVERAVPFVVSAIICLPYYESFRAHPSDTFETKAVPCISLEDGSSLE